MSDSTNIIYNLIYIAVIVLGGATFTLTIILNATEKSRFHRALLFSVGSIFFYMVTDFITYYFLGEMDSGGLVFVLMTLSDILFCILVAAWLYLLIVAMKLEGSFNLKSLWIITIAYIVPSQILSIYLGRYDSYTIQVSGGFWKLVLEIIDSAYDIIIIIIAVRCMILLLKKYEKNTSRTFSLIMICILIGYMVYIAFWDYNTWYRTEENLLNIYAIDPLILIYAVINMFLIRYFSRSNPLKISASQLSPTDAVDAVVKQYSLTKREADVLALVNRGLTNKEIAAELFISENTVKHHMNNIFRKTGSANRHDLMLKISNAK